MNKHICRTLLAGSVLALGLHQAVAGDSASGFITDMPAMEQDADRPGAMIWIKPGVNRADYPRVMIEPVTIFISPDSKYQGINPEDLAVLSHKFIDTMTNTLEPEVPVVNKSGPGVLYESSS